MNVLNVDIVSANKESRMKLKNIENVDGFFKAIDSCSGKVELIGEGLQINLKSKLAQYFSLAKVFANGAIDEVELVVHEKEDIEKLLKFMMEG